MAISGSPLLDTFTYHTDLPLSPGERVVVDFANRNVVAYVVEITEELPEFDTKPILQKLDVKPFLTSKDVELALRISERFLCPIGKIFDLFFPPGKVVNVKSFVVPQSQELPIKDIMPLAVAREKFGAEAIEKWRRSKRIKIVHSYEQKRAKVQKKKFVRLRLSIKDLDKIKLTDLQSKVVEHLFSFDVVGIRDLVRDLGLKSPSPIQSLEKKGIIEIFEDEIHEFSDWTIAPIDELTTEQRKVLNSIMYDFKGTHLIYGLTGTGKTEVYFKAMEKVLTEGAQVLYLVPEVSLTPQLLARVKGTFPGREVRVYHSYLSRAKRQAVWLDAHEGNVDIIIGTRSAIWIPMRRPGLIIVDEEHDASFYQQSSPHYDAVEVAVEKGKLHNIPIILGSATPRVTHYFRAIKGEYRLHKLKHRPVGSLPSLELIDMRKSKGFYVLSKKALEEVKELIKAGKQVFVFVHRKGFSNYVVCTNCGTVIKCPNCDISLTYHRHGNVLKCHYCGFATMPFSKCPNCGSAALSARGFGTERVEYELRKFFPSVKIIRLDKETIESPSDYEKALRMIEQEDAQVVVGTKMIAKGLDFPKVGCVIVVDSDRLINLPRYDATENAFQLITQASGRSGRGTFGKTLIQSFNPDHPVIQNAVENDFERFFETEIETRELLKYPPFSYFVEMIVEHVDEKRCQKKAEEIAELIGKEFSEHFFEIHGPVVPVIKKFKGRFRMKIFLKLKPEASMMELRELIKKHSAQIDLVVDGIGGML